MSHRKYKYKQAKGFFDETFRLEQLTATKDPPATTKLYCGGLVKLKERIDFELFRSLLEETLYKG